MLHLTAMGEILRGASRRARGAPFHSLGLSGLQPARRERGVRTPLIAMTAHAMQGDSRQVPESRMNGYVSKPIQPEVVFEAIEALVSVPS